eukprot:32104-Prorocentrum_minimum.AAC.6
MGSFLPLGKARLRGLFSLPVLPGQSPVQARPESSPDQARVQSRPGQSPAQTRPDQARVQSTVHSSPLQSRPGQARPGQSPVQSSPVQARPGQARPESSPVQSSPLPLSVHYKEAQRPRRHLRVTVELPRRSLLTPSRPPPDPLLTPSWTCFPSATRRAAKGKGRAPLPPALRGLGRVQPAPRPGVCVCNIIPHPPPASPPRTLQKRHDFDAVSRVAIRAKPQDTRP